MQKTLVQFLGWYDPLEKEWATHPNILGLLLDSASKESACSAWRRERLLTPVFWPGQFHGLYSTWGCKESDTTEWRWLHSFSFTYQLYSEYSTVSGFQFFSFFLYSLFHSWYNPVLIECGAHDFVIYGIFVFSASCHEFEQNLSNLMASCDCLGSQQYLITFSNTV